MHSSSKRDECIRPLNLRLRMGLIFSQITSARGFPVHLAPNARPSVIRRFGVLWRLFPVKAVPTLPCVARA